MPLYYAALCPTAFSAAFSIFSMKIPSTSVGAATHNQAKRVCKLACERVSADCSASVLLCKTRRIARPKYRSASKEYNVRYSSDELAVLDDGRARHECVQVGITILYSFQIDIEGVQEKKVKIFMPFCV